MVRMQYARLNPGGFRVRFLLGLDINVFIQIFLFGLNGCLYESPHRALESTYRSRLLS